MEKPSFPVMVGLAGKEVTPMPKVADDTEEFARFVARKSWLDSLERECVRWGVPRSQVIVDAVTRCALGPEGLRVLYGQRATIPRRDGKIAPARLIP
jgi:hypothetical protein